MDEFAPALAALQTKLKKQTQDVRETKRLINELTKLSGGAAPYPDADGEDHSPVTIGTMRRDQFYGMPLATAIRQYLEMRRASSLGPATVNDIYAALCAGGFKFDAKNEANAKRGLYISLAKNSVTFHKLPGGTDETSVFGLLEWYPSAKAPDEPKKPYKRPKLRRKIKVKEAKTPAPEQPSLPKLLPAPAAKPKPKMHLVNGKLVPDTKGGKQHEESTSAGSAAR